MNLKIIIVTSFILMFCYVDAKSQDCVFTLKTVTTPSDCFANGTVKVTVEGADVAHLSLADAQYKIQELGGQGHSTGFAKNGGEFSDLHKGNYIVTMRVFCQKNGITVDKQSATFTITGNYVAPNMYVDVNNTIKTLSCKNSGRLAIFFNHGKAPYTVKILSSPPEYTGVNEFTIANTGLSYIEDLPAGAYGMELKDACGNTFVTSGTIATLSTDFIPFSIGYTFKDGDDCKKLRISFYSIATTHELYYYSENFNKYYDVFLQEDAGALVAKPEAKKDVDGLHFSLDQFTYSDLYTASNKLGGGGHTAKLFFKVKGCNTYSPPLLANMKRPYSSSTSFVLTCDGAVVRSEQYTDYDGVICYPYKAEIKNAADNSVIATKENIPDSKGTVIGTVPYGIEFYVVFTGADGGQWSTTSHHNPNDALQTFLNRDPYIEARGMPNSFCSENLHTGYIQIYLKNILVGASSFPVGTHIKPLEVPAGMALSPDTILNSEVVYYTPYGASYNILPGTYKWEVTIPCLNIKETVTVNFGAIYPAYRQSVSNTYCIEGIGKVRGNIILSGSKIPGGSTFKYLGATPSTAAHDAAVVHKNFVMPSATSQYFNPFSVNFSSNTEYSAIPVGAYKFEVYDAFCNYTQIITIDISAPYTVNDFGYTTDTLCDGLKLYPLGQMKAGATNAMTYFHIVKAINENGSNMLATEYPTNVITKGGFFTLQRNGYYTLCIKYNNSNSTCYADTVTVHYKQPSPSLNYKLTASFVCKEASANELAFIKLVGVGGYGNGPYEYEILGAVPEQKNMTGEFNYGKVNDVLRIKITDKSPQALSRGCVSYIEQNVTVLDLSEASIAYSENNGNFCEGETIKINVVSLGNTQYKWKGPNGFTSTEQFPEIPNATASMNGYYSIEVTPENCGDLMKDSVLITVHPNPIVPAIGNANPYVCYNSGFYELATLTGASATAPGNSLKWYDSNGLPLASTSILSLGNTFRTYYVSQVVDATLCEGPRVLVTIEIKALPIAPIVPSPAAVCYMENYTICVSNPDINYKYRIYSSSSTAVIIQEMQGTATPSVCFTPFQYNTISATIDQFVATVDQFGCESKPRATVVAKMSPTAVMTNVVINDTTVCRNSAVTLVAKASPDVVNPQFIWYNGTAASSTVLATGNTYTTPVLNSAIHNYYIGIKGDGLCETVPTNRRKVIVRTNPLATAATITAPNGSVCAGGDITLQATAGAVTNPIFYWYTDAVSLVPIHEGSSFQHNSVIKDTAFYVSVNGDNYCENLPVNRRKVSITANGYTGHSINSVHPSFGVSNGSITVDFGTFKNIKYKFNNIGVWVTVTGFNNPVTFSNLAEGSYRFQIDAGGCSDLDTTIILKSKIIANNDEIIMFKGTTVNINISANDSDPGRAKLRDSILIQSSKGTAILSEPRDGTLKYTNNGQTGTDSVRYVLKSAYETAEAKVLIYILNKPEIVLTDNCSFAPYMLLSQTYVGAIYAWEFSDDNGATWTDLNISEAKCPAINAGHYRVKIRIGSSELNTDYKELIVIKKTIVLNKTWYEVSLN